jgi:hypothetical protein
MRAANTLALLCFTLLLLSFTAWSSEDNSTSDLNGTSNFTDNSTLDTDSDGFTLTEDCDDTDPSINPNATEVCNALDDNCDNIIDEGFDQDTDGFFPEGCTGYQEYDCDDNDPSINPAAAEILANGIDDDCNPYTSDTPYFAVETEPEYYLSEAVTFTLYAPENTTSYVTITTPSPSHNTITTYTGTYPHGEPVPYTRLAGDYTIDVVFEYANITDTSATQFVVLNTISGSISAPSSADKDETVNIAATAAGGLGTLSYYWKFGDGAAASGSSVVHTYTVPGSYTIELTIEDSEGNTWNNTRLIDIWDRYSVTVEVREGDAKINNAKVKLHGFDKYTDEDGLVVFKSIPQGTHELTVTKSGYEKHSEDIEVTSNMTKKVTLEEEDDQAPSITLVFPSDNHGFTGDSITVRFKASDNEEMECVLYLSTDNSWWSKEAVFERLATSVDKSYTLTNLSAGTYWWKVRCRDESANALFSESRKFKVQQPQQQSQDSGPEQEPPPVNQQPADTDEDTELYSQISDILDNLAGLPVAEKRAARLIGLEDKLLELKKELQELNRDLFNLRYRRVNSSERSGLQAGIEQEIENAKKGIVSGIHVIGQNDYVKYLTKEEVEKAVDELGLSMNARRLHKMQSVATVSATVMVMELDYLFGGTEKKTYVEKVVSMTDTEGMKSVLEIIPKEIASHVDELEVEGDYTVLKEDPVLSFEAGGTVDIRYSINRELSPSSLESTLTLVLPTELDEEPEVTGRAVGNLVPVNKTAVLVVIVCMLLIGTVVGYFWDSIPIERFTDQELKHARSLAADIRSRLSRDELEPAKEKYQELEQFYRTLGKDKKARLNKNLMDVYHNIRFLEFKSLMNEMKQHIRNKDSERLAQLHQDANSYYSSLPEHYKRRAIYQYKRLHKTDEN